MTIVDMSNTWIYKGSQTTPPCDTNVYWNVLSTVYPLSKKHLDLFVDKHFPKDLAQNENFREIQQEDDHNVIYLKGGFDTSADSEIILLYSKTHTIPLVFLSIIGALSSISLCIICY